MIALLLTALLFVQAPASDGQRNAPASTQHEEELRLCVELVNQYRATIKLSPLKRSPALEEFAARAAANDGRAHAGHQYFRRTRGGGVSHAENAIPWWPLSQVGGIRGALEQGVQMMWDEGPRGGHYRNMTGKYSQMGCGIYVNGDQVTIVQEFR
jgi:uncharacterized protein YkwD